MQNLTKILKNPFSPATNEKFEKQILKLLKRNLNPSEVFKKIKNSSDFEQISRFLYNSGLDKTLLDYSSQRLKKKKPIAWAYILKIFIKYKIKSSDRLERVLFHHWLKDKKNQSEALFACKDWEDVSPEFQQLRNVYIQELEERNLSEEKELLDQLKFVQVQRLIIEEEEIIEKLLLIDSENKKYQKLKRDLEEKKAILVIEDQKKITDKFDDLEDYISPIPLFEKHPLKESWFETVSLIVKQDANYTKNLSVFLYFCNWPDKALQILSSHINKMSDYWFYLDWALETKQYTKGLELINHLSMELKESELFFLPLTYIKSQMLYALGRKTEAIDHLSTIVQVKPDYKSALYLLDKWSKNI